MDKVGALTGEIEALWRIASGGAGTIADAADIDVAPGGRLAAFTGSIVVETPRALQQCICLIDLVTGAFRRISGSDRQEQRPKFSPENNRLAFLRSGEVGNVLVIAALDEETERVVPIGPGWVEYFHWSADGRHILIGVADHGVALSSGHGAVVTPTLLSSSIPGWYPKVDEGRNSQGWRRVWLFDLVTGGLRQVSPEALNVWEANWCGSDSMAAIVSAGSREGLWYGAVLVRCEFDGGVETLLEPRYQIARPTGSPSGRHVAVIEAIASDRGIAAGALRLINRETGEVETADTCGVDVSFIEWRSDERLLLAGHRGGESVSGIYVHRSKDFAERWSSVSVSGVGRAITVAGIGEDGDFAFVSEGFLRAPEIASVVRGAYRTIFRCGGDAAQMLVKDVAVELADWRAYDDLRIEGWLLRPNDKRPLPTVMAVHGGPVLLWKPAWLGRGSGLALLALLHRGYAVFLPNPRGSMGYGTEFAHHVIGDMAGADVGDLLSGLDQLVKRGMADPARLGVTGSSYGGYMTSWLITQDDRFAAAVAVAPVTNRISAYLTSNIPEFTRLFFGSDFDDPSGPFFRKSPIFHAARVRTPTLHICGALDRCTPAAEAEQFHHALLDQGVRSTLVTYPDEGHGVSSYPALFDYAARLVDWFARHMPAYPEAGTPGP